MAPMANEKNRNCTHSQTNTISFQPEAPIITALASIPLRWEVATCPMKRSSASKPQQPNVTVRHRQTLSCLLLSRKNNVFSCWGGTACSEDEQRDMLPAEVNCYDEQRDENTHHSYPGQLCDRQE